MDIQGRWTGHYFLDLFRGEGGNVYEIEAWFEVEDGVLTGTMLDCSPSRERRFADISAEWLSSRSSLSLLELRMYLAKKPNCVYRVDLFPESNLVGNVEGDRVWFTKTYAGPCDYVYVNGDVETITRRLNFQVRFVGNISEDGDLIEGSYVFLSGSQPEGLRTFELRRVFDEEA